MTNTKLVIPEIIARYQVLHIIHAKRSLTFGKPQRCSKTASGPPFLRSWIEIDATLLAGMRPSVFSSTHYYERKYTWR